MDILFGVLYLVWCYVRDTTYIIYAVHASVGWTGNAIVIAIQAALLYVLGMYYVYVVLGWHVVACLVYVLSSRYRHYHRTTAITWLQLREY